MKKEIKRKLKKANEIVKGFCNKHWKSSHWIYIDFVKEDRFLDEIASETSVDIEKDSAEELAEFAIEQIDKGSGLSNLFGF